MTEILYSIGKQPVTAEEWAHEILAGDWSLGCAAPAEIYIPKHKRLADDIRAIQQQAREKALAEAGNSRRTSRPKRSPP